MDWLDPWWSTEGLDESFHATFHQQLQHELAPDHLLYGLPVQLIGRGNGDDTLFQILDGSGRVAQVHLTWGSQVQPSPWPRTAIYANLDEWSRESMLPEHREWIEAENE